MTQTRTVLIQPDQNRRDATLQELMCLSVPQLAQLLAFETRRFLKDGLSDDLPGLALFMVAIGGRSVDPTRSDDAWAAIYQQYAPLVLTWVSQHQSAAPLLQWEGSAALVNAAFAKFSQALTPAKMDNFDSLAAILRYLKKCVHSVITDGVRSHRSRQHEETLELLEHEPASEDPADDIVSTLSDRGLWQAIQEELNGEEERALIYLAYFHGMKAGEISRHLPHLFPTVDDVYRVKRNILERLRRNRRLEHLVCQRSAA